jgi:hypothetical protein
MAVTFNLFKKKKEEEEKQPLMPASGYGTQYANNLNKSTTQRYVNSLTSGNGLPNTLGLPKPSFRSSEDMFNLSNDLLNKSRTYQQQKEEQQEKPPGFQIQQQQQQQTSLPSYITGYESLAERQKALLDQQKNQAKDYYEKSYNERNRLLEQSIPKLQSQVRTATANIQKGIGSAQQSAEYKKQNAEDRWGESQRLAAQTRNESEARNRNRFAALGTTDSWGAGSYGQAQENVESDFNRFTQQGLRTKEQNMFEIDRALQDYEIEAQTQIDTLEANLSNTVDQIQSSINLNNIDKQNMIDEAFAKYQQGVLAVDEGMQNVYAQYYQALQNAEANSLSFDDNGQPLNQASYEWMLKNPDEYKAAFNSTDRTSATKVKSIIEQLAKAPTKDITGRLRLQWSDDARSAAGLVKQLSSELQIEEAKRLKGQGSMSDAERAILANSISAMNPDKNGLPQVSDTRFKDILDELYAQFGGSGSAKTNITKFES